MRGDKREQRKVKMCTGKRQNGNNIVLMLFEKINLILFKFQAINSS